uniref:Uncharacterized protein n=1 Tax=Onchocerca volvulus TaxID=6282 RepID=A0A8R1TT64_ONCVO
MTRFGNISSSIKKRRQKSSEINLTKSKSRLFASMKTSSSRVKFRIFQSSYQSARTHSKNNGRWMKQWEFKNN